MSNAQVSSALIGVVMGSSSDWEIMKRAVEILQEFGIAHEAQVVSAHRMPDDMFRYAETARSRGLRAIIAGAGGAAHLPGMLAAKTSFRFLVSQSRQNICKVTIHCCRLCKCLREFLSRLLLLEKPGLPMLPCMRLQPWPRLTLCWLKSLKPFARARQKSHAR